MITEAVYRKKFSLLHSFVEEIFKGIKKEIRREMTVKGSLLQRKVGILPASAEVKDLVHAFLKNILSEDGEDLGEWVACAWINRHADIFQCFHEHLVKFSSKYDELTEIPGPLEMAIAKDAESKFGALNTYIFCILNSVVFSGNVIENLRKAALAEKEAKKEKIEKVSSVSLEEMQKKFEDQIEKILEKQEKKLLGLTQKYQIEIAGYRKQIGQLQKKLEEACGKSG